MLKNFFIGSILLIIPCTLNADNDGLSMLVGFLQGMSSILNPQTVMQAQSLSYQAETLSMQERWNEWNSLVSLLAQDQKAKVLELNQVSDDELRNMWISSWNSTQTIPFVWLMPTKRDSCHNSIEVYMKNHATLDEFFGYAELLEKQLGKKHLEKYWRQVNPELKKRVWDYLKKKKKNYEINSAEDYYKYIYFVEGKLEESEYTNKIMMKKAALEYLKRKQLLLEAIHEVK